LNPSKKALFISSGRPAYDALPVRATYNHKPVRTKNYPAHSFLIVLVGGRKRASTVVKKKKHCNNLKVLFMC